MPHTLSGKVTDLATNTPIPFAAIRLIAPLSQLQSVPGSQAFSQQSWGWSRAITGFSGTRWQLWERFLQNRIGGLQWGEFCDTVLAINPALHATHIFDSTTSYLIPELVQAPRFSWTRRLNGFSGSRWNCWEALLQDKVPELQWQYFCDNVLQVNPWLQSDRIFKTDQSYLIPEASTQALGYIDGWSDGNGDYFFNLGEQALAVTISAHTPNYSYQQAIWVSGQTVHPIVCATKTVAKPLTSANQYGAPAVGSGPLKSASGSIPRPAEPIQAPAPQPLAINNGSIRSNHAEFQALPAQVQQLIRQALFMLGNDPATFDLLKPEHQRMCYGSEFLNQPSHRHYKDIVCADLVAVALVAAGFDLKWSAYSGNTRLADYYHPRFGDGKLIELNPNTAYLPGDIFVFGNGSTNSKAAHVSLYVGPFSGTDRNGYAYPTTSNCEVVDASMDYLVGNVEKGTNVRGIPLAHCLNRQYGTFQWVRRVRLRQIAQLFGV
jgi:hypothetical protein